MKPETAIQKLQHLTELRARARGKANRITDQIRALESAKAERTSVDASERIQQLLDGSKARNEAEELVTLHRELESLEASLRDGEPQLSQAHRAASAEYCEQYVESAYDRLQKQIAAMRTLRDLNEESEATMRQVHGAGYDVAGSLRITTFLSEQLDALIESAERDLELHRIAVAPDTGELIECKALSAQRINGKDAVIGERLTLPAKTARTLALYRSVELVTPEAKRAQRMAKLSEVTA